MRDHYGKRYHRDERPFAHERHMEKHHQRGGGHKRKDHPRSGAKTFRRGRAIEFLERLNVKRDTLKQQLETPELQSINPVLVGELKAVETIMNEFIQLFEIHEEEIKQKNAPANGEEELGRGPAEEE